MFSIHDLTKDAPVHNNSVKHGKDGAGDEAIEVAEVIEPKQLRSRGWRK